MIKRHIRRAFATAGLLVTLGAAMALFAPVASASPYCGGTLNAGEECNGAARSLTALAGSGAQHAVCVWADNLGQGCSTGAGGLASVNYGSAAVRTPKIRNVGGTPNAVQAETF